MENTLSTWIKLPLVISATVVPVQYGEAAALTWQSKVNGFWDVAGNWSSNPALPAGADTLTLNQPGLLSITHRSGTDAVTTINSQEVLSFTGGTLTVSGSYTNSANTQIAGGRLNLNGASTLQSVDQTGGTLGGSGAVTVSGASTLSGGLLTGSGNLLANGGLAVTGSFGLDAGRILTNLGTASWTGGSINLNADAFAGSGSLVNAAGATWRIEGNNPATVYANNYGAADSGASAAFSNAGTLIKADSTVSDVTTISTQFNNTGTVDVQSGILQLSGNSNQAGVVTVASGAELGLNGGTHTLSNTSTTVDGFLRVNGGTVNLTTAQTVSGAGTFVQSGGTVKGAALTISGGAELGGGIQSGASTTSLKGNSLVNGSFGLDAGRVLRNEGTLTWTAGTFNLNGDAFAGSGSLVNTAGASLLIQGNNPNSLVSTNRGTADNGASAVLTNAGLIRKLDSVATDDTTISVKLENTGTLDVASGRLRLDSSSTHTGATLTGAGILAFGGSGAAHSLDATTQLSSANLEIYGGKTTAAGAVEVSGGTTVSGGSLHLTGAVTSLGESVSVASNGLLDSGSQSVGVGFYNQTSGTLLNNGELVVAGSALLSGGTVTGSGSIQAYGTVTVRSAGFDGGQVVRGRDLLLWDSGSIDLNASYYDPDTAQTKNRLGAARIQNDAGALFEAQGYQLYSSNRNSALAGDDGLNARIDNAGLFRKTGSGATYVDVVVNNTGTLDAAEGTFYLRNGSNQTGVLQVQAGGNLELAGGTHNLNSTANTVEGNLRLSSGTLNVVAEQTIGGTGSFNQTGGLIKGANLTVAGIANLSGGSQSGASTTTLKGATTIAGSIGLDAGRTLKNEGTLSWTSGYINLNDSGTTGSGTLVNAAGASFEIQGNNAYQVYASNNGTADNGSGASFSNAGTLRKSGSTTNDNTNIATSFTNTGTVDVQTGVLQFSGNSTLGGSLTIADGAELLLNGGTHTVGGSVALASGGSLRINGGTVSLANAGNSLAGEVGLSGGTLDLGAAQTLAASGSYTQSSGTLKGANLTVSGAAALSGGSQSGASTTALKGTTTITGSIGLDAGRTLKNEGTLSWTSGYINLNDSGTTGSGTLVNAAGASFEIQGNNAYQVYASNNGTADNGSGASFSNAGTLRKSGSTTNDNTNIATSFTNTGTVDVQTGVLQFSGNSTLGGSLTIADGAELLLNGGTHTLGGSLSVSNGGTLHLAGGTLDLAAAQTLGGTGSFSQTGGLIKGANLTVAGTANLSGGSQSGASTTTLKGATTIAGSIGLDAGRTLKNEGTLSWTSGYINLNDSGATGSGTLVNAAGASFEIQGNNAYQVYASNNGTADNGSGASFSNAGTLRKSGSTTNDNTNIATSFTNTGTVDVQTGVLQFSGNSTLGGSLTIADGAELLLNGGTHTVGGSVALASGGSLRVTGGTVSLANAGNSLAGEVALSGGTLDLGAAQTLAVSGSYTQSSGTLKGANLTVSGAAALSGGSQSGAATTALKGATTIAGSIGLDAGRTLKNEGTLSWTSGYINLNDSGTTGSGTLVNAAGASFEIQGNNAYQVYASNNGTADNGSGASFSNAGTLRKSGSTTNDNTNIATSFTNTGTVDVQTGVLQFSGNSTLGGSLTIADGAELLLNGGTHTVGGSVALASGGSLRINGGTVSLANAGNSLAGEVGLSGGTLDLGAAQTLAASGSYTQSSGTLKGANLTVSGAAALSGGSQSGASTTALKGTTTITGSIGLDAGRTLKNEGTLSWTSGYINLNDSGTTGSGTLVNAAGASFEIQGNNAYQVYASNNGTADNGSGASFSNAGTLRKSGSTTNDNTNIATSFTNTGTVDVQTGVLQFSGQLTNAGSIKVSGGQFITTAAFQQNGELALESGSVQVGSVTVGGSGYIAAAANTRIVVQDDFNVQSTQKLAWNTLDGILEFSAYGNHDFLLAGVDLGAVESGYTDNFAWGGLKLDTGAVLNLKDGNAVNGAALYVGALELGGGISQLANINSAFDIYYDVNNALNAYLGGSAYALTGGGQLTAVSTLALFALSAPSPVAAALIGEDGVFNRASADAIPTPLAPSVWLFASGILPMLRLYRRRGGQ
ncbi:hypothetical protein [Methylococcus sp. EFPC2]|uniref:hypothetical protein n=1 Tax=Methylococcus sp. EFPC2 TaxID=2812648 RepID=UPI0019684BE0|nr:hypothetical protein [Methylococcus sp. EFPC2]QSA95832.1 hypothetical protein JWZ97_11330 [Methylococcus sp. EFPC2]